MDVEPSQALRRIGRRHARGGRDHRVLLLGRLRLARRACDAVFGVLDVNGWHNVVHILTGALGLLAFGAGVYAARQYALALGVVYLVVAVWGFIVGDGDSILSIIPVNTEDNVLHLLIGLAGLGAGLATAEADAQPPTATG